MSNTVVAHLVEPLAGGKEYLLLDGIYLSQGLAVISIELKLAQISDKFKYVDISEFNERGVKVNWYCYEIKDGKLWLECKAGFE